MPFFEHFTPAFILTQIRHWKVNAQKSETVNANKTRKAYLVIITSPTLLKKIQNTSLKIFKNVNYRKINFKTC